MMEYATKITALYSRLSVGYEDRDGGESNSIVNQKSIFRKVCKRYLKKNTIHLYRQLSSITEKLE